MSYQLLSERSAALSLQYPEDDGLWEGSPFNWVRNKSAPTKGKVGREFAASLVEAAGFQVMRSGMALTANGKALRVKLSLMGEGGTLMFEQIKNDDFDYLLCIGLYPENSYGWLIPKEEMLVNGILQEREGLSGQHIGDADPSDFWITDLNASQPFTWLQPYGGTTAALIPVIQQNL